MLQKEMFQQQNCQ